LHYRYFTPTRTRRIYGEIIQHYFADMNKMTSEIRRRRRCDSRNLSGGKQDRARSTLLYRERVIAHRDPIDRGWSRDRDSRYSFVQQRRNRI